MDRGRLRALEERVERLERMVTEIHARLGPPAASPVDDGAGRVEASGSTPPPSPPPAPAGREERWAHWSEQWLGRVGLGLLFLGLVYLFNYTIEQGWITPAVRVAIGLAIATAFLALGLRLEQRRRSFSQLLLAGSLGVYYVSGFAAFQLYHLVSYGLAWAYMAAVTTLGLVLARRQNHPALATLGALGGFATPLLLNRASPAVIELSVYTALVVAWTGAMYWLRGWPTLLWTYTAGGLAALSVAERYATGGERWVVQGALLLTWLAGAGLPFLRGVVMPESRLSLRRAWGRIPAPLQLRVLGVGATSVALYLTSRTWDLRDDTLGALFLLIALLYALFAWIGTRRSNPVASAAAPVAAALCATGTFLVIDGLPLRTGLLAGEALVFVYAGASPRFPGLAGVGHTLFALLALDLAQEAASEPRVAGDSLAWAQLLGLALALLASRFVATPRSTRAYRLGGHALFLLWLAKELGAVASGTGLVTLAWGAYGTLLLLLALRWRDHHAAHTHGLQLVALSAIALAVAKLLFVDLDRVAIVWRICMFMGFGGALIALSSLFKPEQSGTGRDPA